MNIIYKTEQIYEYIKDQALDVRLDIVMCGIIFMIGARMAMGALYCILSYKWSLVIDLPRYRYQEYVYNVLYGEGSWNMYQSMKEIFIQCYANFAVLILPLALVCSDKYGTGDRTVKVRIT